ncbi:MAG: HAD-IB family phosphatase [Deltaproteobacteria bacterium]|nr:HAD-IB family phosphatase [Deltaproteobacteria bacterium]
MTGERVALVLDFDGTATPADVGGALIERFARDESWRVIDNDFENGRIGSRMAYRLLEDLLGGTPEEWERHALETFAVDAGLGELRRLAESRGWLLEILSDGLGYYIRALLGRAGLRLPLRTNELVAGDGAEGSRLRIVTPHLNPRCGRCGTCKSERVEALAADGWRVVYVGDGYSDLCAAPRAHRLFAKSVLASHCRERGIPFEPFDNLGDVAVALLGNRAGT